MVMKIRFYRGIVLITLFISCRKNHNEEKCDTFFNITTTQTPASVSVLQGINTTIKSYGGNSCYSFSKTDVRQASGNAFEIRSIGKVSCNGDLVCVDVLIGATDNVHIPTSIPGIYILKFFNGNSFFKADTVQVN